MTDDFLFSILQDIIILLLPLPVELSTEAVGLQKPFTLDEVRQSLLLCLKLLALQAGGGGSFGTLFL